MSSACSSLRFSCHSMSKTAAPLMCFFFFFLYHFQNPPVSRMTTRKHFYQLLLSLSAAVLLLRLLFFTNDTTIPADIPADINPREEAAYNFFTLRSELPTVEPCTQNISIQSSPSYKEETKNFKDFLTYRHCRAFPLLLDSPMKCGGPNPKDVFLLLAIKSSPGNFERRETIRKTWGKEKSYGGSEVKRIFLTGVPRNKEQSKRMSQLLFTESQIYGDIVQWTFEDSFYNLTLKQVLFHQWFAQKCPGAKFVFNGDDDVFVHTTNVITFLRSTEINRRDRHLFIGALNVGMPLVREKPSKYYVSKELFPNDYYEPYCGGGGILMSGFTVSSIHKVSKHIPLIPIDDAYLGMCLKRAGLAPENHQAIYTLGFRFQNNVDTFDPCYYRHMLIVHRFMPYEMLIMWKALQISNLACIKPAKMVNVTNFNWV